MCQHPLLCSITSWKKKKNQQPWWVFRPHSTLRISGTALKFRLLSCSENSLNKRNGALKIQLQWLSLWMKELQTNAALSRRRYFTLCIAAQLIQDAQNTKVSQFRPDQFPKSRIWLVLRKLFYLILWVCRTTENYHAVTHVNSHSHGSLNSWWAKLLQGFY